MAPYLVATTSSSSSYSLSLSSPAVRTLLAFVIVVVGLGAVCALVVVCVQKVVKMVEKRGEVLRESVKDVEDCSESVVSVVSVEKTEDSILPIPANIYSPKDTAPATTNEPIFRSSSLRCPLARITSTGATYTRPRRSPASVTPAPSPLRSCVFSESDLLVEKGEVVVIAPHGEDLTAVTKEVHMSVMPMRTVLATRSHLHLVVAASARFDIIGRTGSAIGSSPFREVTNTSAVDAAPEAPSIAVSVAAVLRSACSDSFDDITSCLADFDDENDDPFSFDAGFSITDITPTPTSVPAPAPAPNLDIPTIIVVSCSSDNLAAISKPTGRQRSNSFMGWKQGHAPAASRAVVKRETGSGGAKENEGFLTVSYTVKEKTPTKKSRRSAIRFESCLSRAGPIPIRALCWFPFSLIPMLPSLYVALSICPPYAIPFFSASFVRESER
ncbi:hypothetical protein R3P38DRAFT_3559755 [Favolaschia claudopus]|uniref:Uncharacterized protein n=1 Tax=Favolaschia claudopus TaxID=2862362 RepID=A0AAW0AW80_9AGAR